MATISRFFGNRKLYPGDTIVVEKKERDKVDVTSLASDILSITSSILTTILVIDNLNKP